MTNYYNKLINYMILTKDDKSFLSQFAKEINEDIKVHIILLYNFSKENNNPEDIYPYCENHILNKYYQFTEKLERYLEKCARKYKYIDENNNLSKTVLNYINQIKSNYENPVKAFNIYIYAIDKLILEKDKQKEKFINQKKEKNLQNKKERKEKLNSHKEAIKFILENKIKPITIKVIEHSDFTYSLYEQCYIIPEKTSLNEAHKIISTIEKEIYDRCDKNDITWQMNFYTNFFNEIKNIGFKEINNETIKEHYTNKHTIKIDKRTSKYKTLSKKLK